MNKFYIAQYRNRQDIVKAEIPQDTIIIPQDLFCNCINLKTVSLPNGIESIGKWAFLNDFSLEEINFPPSLKTIGLSAFHCCISLKSIDLSNTQITVLEEDVFNSCANLETVILPKTLKRIERNAFKHNINLKKVKFDGDSSDIESVNIEAFLNDVNLHGIDCNNGLVPLITRYEQIWELKKQQMYGKDI